MPGHPDTASIELAKSSSPQAYSSAGTVITYSYTVINSGNVTLHGVSVTDPMPGLSAISCPQTTLAPPAQEVCTATYTTTQADVDIGSINNTGTVSGLTPQNVAVSDTATDHVPAIPNPAHHLGQVGQPQDLLVRRHADHLQLPGDQHRQLTLDPVERDRPHARTVRDQLPRPGLGPRRV